MSAPRATARFLDQHRSVNQPTTLDGLPDSVRERIWMRATRCPLASGEVLHLQGARTSDVFFVVDGIVKVSISSSAGNEILLDLRTPGELVAHFPALDGREQPSSVQALTTAELLRIKSGDFLDLLAAHPPLARAIMAGLTRQVRELACHLLEVTNDDAAMLVAKRLTELARNEHYGRLRLENHGVIVIEPALSQSDLAGWAGVSHRSAAAALHEFRNDGLISTRRLRIDVLDLDGLERRANQR